jgi:hypothetical protein
MFLVPVRPERIQEAARRVTLSLGRWVEPQNVLPWDTRRRGFCTPIAAIASREPPESLTIVNLVQTFVNTLGDIINSRLRQRSPS